MSAVYRFRDGIVSPLAGLPDGGALFFRSGTATLTLVVLTLWLSGLTPVLASTDPELDALFGAEDFVTLATGRKQLIRQAPAVATVLTADDIQAIGAADLSEVLDLIPGFHSLFRFQGDQFVIRGIRTEGNLSPDVLVMIDGVPQNDIFLANQRRFISIIPLDSIERIEVIRGPYSILYGTDAFAGVINIVTRRYAQVEHSQIGLRGGSFNTKEARWLQKIPIGDGALLALQLRTTDGHAPFFETDAQTRLDALFGTNASLAPATANTDFQDYSILLDYGWKDWRFRARARGREAGLGIGLFGAFDPDGAVTDQQFNLEAQYRKTALHNWDVNADLSTLFYRVETNNVTINPPGAFGLPDGLQGNIGFRERHFRAEASGLFTGLRHHFPRLGAGVEYIEVFDIKESRNFLLDPISGLPTTPLPAVVEVPAEARFARDKTRTLWFAYVQDEWAFAPDWTLTLGIRYDHYSDIGDTLNPRLALVWTATPALTAKFLAGRGFRAPTLLELTAQRSARTLGNPDLDPVTITATELAFNYRPTPSLSLDLALFYHKIEDTIISQPTTPLRTRFENGPDQRGHGAEISARWRIAPALTLSGYYAYQRNQRDTTDDDIGLAPRNKVKLRADWQPWARWRLNTLATYVGDRQRPRHDPRDAPDDYLWVDLNAIYRLTSAASVALTVTNLFNEDAVAPDEPGDEDIPLPGRGVFLNLRYAY